MLCVHRVPTSVLVPSVLRALLEYAVLEAGDDAGDVLLPHLRQVITCGEALPSDLVHALFDACPRVRLDNLYGPTEGEMTVHKCEPGRLLQGGVPIGVPIAGAATYLLNVAGGLAGIGEPGELFFGGPFLALGYLGSPSQTALRFVFHASLGRLYATGDLARWSEGGELEFLGRTDFQVRRLFHREEHEPSVNPSGSFL